MGSVLSQIEEGRTSQLLLNDQRLLQKLEPPSQELVLDLQEVPLAHVHLMNAYFEKWCKRTLKKAFKMAEDFQRED